MMMMIILLLVVAVVGQAFVIVEAVASSAYINDYCLMLPMIMMRWQYYYCLLLLLLLMIISSIPYTRDPNCSEHYTAAAVTLPFCCDRWPQLTTEHGVLLLQLLLNSSSGHHILLLSISSYRYTATKICFCWTTAHEVCFLAVDHSFPQAIPLMKYSIWWPFSDYGIYHFLL